jgi:hypothetical protein
MELKMRYWIIVFISIACNCYGNEGFNCKDISSIVTKVICENRDINEKFLTNRAYLDQLNEVSERKSIKNWWRSHSSYFNYESHVSVDCNIRIGVEISDETLNCARELLNKNNSILKELLRNNFYDEKMKTIKTDFNGSSVGYDLKKSDLMLISGKISADHYGVVSVEVNRNTPVVIVLCSDEKLIWQLKVQKGSKVERVYICDKLSWPYRSVVVSNSMFPVSSIEISASPNQYGEYFYSNLEKFNAYFGVSKLDYFFVNEQLPRIIHVNSGLVKKGASLNGYSPVKLEKNYNFFLVSEDFEYSKLSIYNSNTNKNQVRYATHGVALDEETGVTYRYLYKKLQKINPDGAVEDILIPESPDYRGLKVLDVAYSKGRKILYVLYERNYRILRYSVRDQSWLKPLKIESDDIKWISIDSKTDDVLVLSGRNSRASLYIYDKDSGAKKMTFYLDDYLPEYSLFENPVSEIYSDGDNLVFVRFPGGIITHIWYGNLNNMEFHLTYKRQLL